MNQKFEDFKVLVQNDKRIWAAGGFILVALIIWMATDSGTSRRPRQSIRPANEASDMGSSVEETESEMLAAFGIEIEEARKERQEMASVLVRTQQDAQSDRERVSGIIESIVDKVEEVQRGLDLIAGRQARSEQLITARPTGPAPGSGKLEGFGAVTEDEGVVEPQIPELPPRVSVIAPGDSVSLRLLTGVNAPTDGTPYPVVFELTGPISGPDGATLDVGNARLIAAAQGSEADGRALFRLTQLSITHPSKRRSLVDIDGWIVGEDGVRGMQGELIDKLGRLIFTTAAVSGAAALGNRIGGRNTAVITNGGVTNLGADDFDTAAASALTDASNRLGQVLLNRYESLVPVVEILSGRSVSAIFSKPAEIELINDEALLRVASAAAGN